MATFVQGKSIRVYDLTSAPSAGSEDAITEAQLAAGDIIACAKSASISMSNSVIDITCQGNSASGPGERKIIPGQTSWSASVDTLYTITVDSDEAGSVGLQAHYDGNLPIFLVIGDAQDDGATAGETAGNYYWYGQAYISSIEVSATPGELVTYNVSFEGDGSLTYGTIAASA